MTALTERWHSKTLTFHMAHGELTITLQDAGIILGLPVDGFPFIDQKSRQWPNYASLCLDIDLKRMT